jgi:hypothetical protein
MATLSVGGTTVFDGATLQGLTSATTFPAGHVLRTFYNESDATGETIASGATLYWDELDITIPASSTVDYLIIALNINGILTSIAGSYLTMGLVYSTDSWSTPLQLGTVEYYDRPAYSNTTQTQVLSSTVVIRVNHPTALAYRIRPKLNATLGGLNVNQQPSRSTMLAIEIKG